MRTIQFFAFLGLLAVVVGFLEYTGCIDLYPIKKTQEKVQVQTKVEEDIKMEKKESVASHFKDSEKPILITSRNPINLVEVQMDIGYPKVARDAGIEGEVIVRILVDEKGNYKNHEVLKSSHPILEKAVTEQINQLKFEPVIVKGKGVEYYSDVPFSFKLFDKINDPS